MEGELAAAENEEDDWEPMPLDNYQKEEREVITPRE